MTSCTAAHAPQLLSHSDRGFLLPGSKVTVRWLSGEIALETEYAAAEGSTDCETFLSAVLLVIAKSLNLPARYGCIVWNFNRQARGLTAAEGTINFTGPSELAEDPYESEDWYTCVVCEAPCDDLSEIPGGNTSQNCARCFPCCLCDECRIYLPKEAFGDYARTEMARDGGDAATRDTWPVCFLCLGDDDRAFVEDVTLSRRQDFRLGVLRRDFHALLHSEPTPADLKHAD